MTIIADQEEKRLRRNKQRQVVRAMVQKLITKMCAEFWARNPNLKQL